MAEAAIVIKQDCLAVEKIVYQFGTKLYGLRLPSTPVEFQSTDALPFIRVGCVKPALSLTHQGDTGEQRFKFPGFTCHHSNRLQAKVFCQDSLIVTTNFHFPGFILVIPIDKVRILRIFRKTA